MSWAECPACGAIVGNAELHAVAHARTVATDEALMGVTAPTVTATLRWPKGLAVRVPATLDPTRLADLRNIGRAAIDTIDGDALPALEAYLTLAAPTTAQTVAQVRTLARTTRGLCVAVRALIRIALRSLEED